MHCNRHPLDTHHSVLEDQVGSIELDHFQHHLLEKKHHNRKFEVVEEV